MSRWSVQFEAHPIYETLKDIKGYLKTEPKKMSVEHEAELRRLRKFFDILSNGIDNLDRELVDANILYNLHVDITQNFNPVIYDELQLYSTDHDIQHLQNVNDTIADDGIMGHLTHIMSLPNNVTPKNISDLISDADKAYSDFSQKIEEKRESYEGLYDGFSAMVKEKEKIIEKSYESLTVLQGAAAAKEMAGKYLDEANKARKVAFWWSIVSMICYGLIVAWLVFKSFQVSGESELNWSVIVTTISLTAVAIITAQFASQQSRIHRANEKQMRWVFLEVNAFTPFISSLPDDVQHELKKNLSDRLFGREHYLDDKAQGAGDRGLVEKLITSLARLPREG